MHFICRALLVACLIVAAGCNQDDEQTALREESPRVSATPLQLEGEVDFQLEGIVARASIKTGAEPAEGGRTAWGMLHVLAKAVPQPAEGCPSVQDKIVPIYVATDTVIEPADVLQQRPLERTLRARTVKVFGKAGSHDGKRCVMAVKRLEFQPPPATEGGRAGDAPGTEGAGGAQAPGGAAPPAGQPPAPGVPAPGTDQSQPGAVTEPAPASVPPGGTSSITRRPGTSRVNPLSPAP